LRDERRRRERQRRSEAPTGDHRRAAGVHGLDDLSVVDALEVDRGDPKVAVAHLPLDDDEWHSFVRHLDGVRVAKLVRREASANARGRRHARSSARAASGDQGRPRIARGLAPGRRRRSRANT
jgi:hypothetical protein